MFVTTRSEYIFMLYDNTVGVASKESAKPEFEPESESWVNENNNLKITSIFTKGKKILPNRAWKQFKKNQSFEYFRLGAGGACFKTR